MGTAGMMTTGTYAGVGWRLNATFTTHQEGGNEFRPPVLIGLIRAAYSFESAN